MIKQTITFFISAFILLFATNSNAMYFETAGSSDIGLEPRDVSVVDIIVGSDVHETLATAVVAAGLVDVLSGEGPFTVFAPTDGAFDALPDGVLDDLLDDPEGALTDILFYHVVSAFALSTDLEDSQVITTLLGEDVVVTINADGVFINDAEVIVADLLADNGVVHVIDAVLLPGQSEEQDVITMWDFDGTIEPAIGNGIASLVGGTIEVDLQNRWRMVGFPDQFENSATAGAQFMVSTEGYENITLTFGHRSSGTQSRWAEIHYTLDGGDSWEVLDNNSGGLSPHDIIYDFSFNFSDIAGADNNTDFGIRIVSIFSPVAFNPGNPDEDFETNTAYHRARVSGGGAYAGGEDGGNWRLHDVTISGTPLESLPATTVVDIIVGSDVHETLATAVVAAGLVDALSGEGPFTVFAPTDDAFDALPDGVLDDLLDDPEGALTDILLYHVVAAYALSTDLENGQVIETLLGEDVVVTISEDGVFINDAEVIVVDLLAENGVVHVIDAVLIPTAPVEVVLMSDEELGVYISDADGFPLYFFSLDAHGESMCEGGCLDIWPIFYSDNLVIGEGLDPDDFDVIERADGDMQTTYKGWPLYYFVNDPGADGSNGDDLINGDGINNVWFVAKPDYSIMLVNNQLVGLDGNNYTGDYEIGEEIIQYFTDDAGVTLYTWINDNYNLNNFTNSDFSNNHIWPVYEQEEVVVPSTLDASLFSVVDVFGTPQLAYKGWPLYYFGQDNGIRGNTLGVSVPAPGVWPVPVADMDAALYETVVDIIVGSAVHETLATAVVAAGLIDALSGEGPFTVFAPTDDAFDALPDGVLDDLLDDPEGALTDILLYHVVAAYALSTDLENGQVIETLLGEDVVVTISEDGVFINDAEVIVADLLAENGVVHVIDAVLIPAEDDPVDAIDDFPFTENFEDEWLGEPLAPENWTVVNGAEGSYWERSSLHSNTGEFSARSYQGFASDNLADEWLISPALNLDNPDATQLLFYGYSNQAPDGVRENMRILILDDIYDNTDDLHANATLIQVVPFTAEWDEYIIDLESYGGIKYIAFNYYITEEDNASFNWIYIDDVIFGTFETFALTMLAPEGEGTVTPAEGVYQYTEGTEVTLFAEPDFGWEFSHWTGDVADPNSASTIILMDDDYTVQANFIPFDGIELPWAEDFSGMQNGTIPANWARDVNNWGVFNSSNAGGEAPEMRFHWSPNITGEFYLYSPKINTSGNDVLELSFKNFVNNFNEPGSYTLRVVTIADGVEYLIEEWVDPDDVPAYVFEATLTATDHGVGTDDFHIAWVFDGVSNDINWWNFDDILLTTGEPQPDIARAQIIHNSADALVEEVDIFVNGDLFLEDVGFRQATPFMDVPAGVDLDLVIAPAGAGIENGVGPITVQFDADETYVIVAAGNVSAEGYDPVEPFALYVYDMGQEEAQNPINTDLLAFHGSTDAPTVSIWETTTVEGEIIGDFSFGDFAGYLPLIPGDYIIEVRDASGEVTVAAYSAPLASLGLQGEAIVAVASGFLVPENNSDGPAFGLFVALASGGELIELPLVDDDVTYTVSFNITNELGNPVTDAIVTLGEVVNEAGDYNFENVPAGIQTYSVSAVCYAVAAGEVMVDQDVEINITLELDILPGDANGDGVVDVLDIIAMQLYFIGLNPQPFCFHNADVNNDGIVNILDIVAVVNIFAKGDMTPYVGMQSQPANIYLSEKGINLDSDGTLAGIQFEISGSIPSDIRVKLEMPGFELVYVYEDGTIRGLIFSLDNQPIPSGLNTLLTFDRRLPALVWVGAIAGNINSDEVELITHDNGITNIEDLDELNISVYPNPASDVLWVDFDNQAVETRISFVNVNGQLVRSQVISEQGPTQVMLEIGDLPAGIYMLRIDHNDSSYVRRVVVK